MSYYDVEMLLEVAEENLIIINTRKTVVPLAILPKYDFATKPIM